MNRRFAFFVAQIGAVVAGCGGSSERRGDRDDGGASGSAMGGMSGSAMGGAGTGPMAGAGGSIDDPEGMRSCDVPSDCVLVPSFCCLCGETELSDMTAVNARSSTEFSRRLCAMMPPCTCTRSDNPNFVATCESGRCAKTDVRQHAASACVESEDCRVRVTECCECGGDTSPGRLIAVGRAPGYEELACAPTTPCPECEPSYPAEAQAVCNDGHCVLIDTRL